MSNILRYRKGQFTNMLRQKDDKIFKCESLETFRKVKKKSGLHQLLKLAKR